MLSEIGLPYFSNTASSKSAVPNDDGLAHHHSTLFISPYKRTVSLSLVSSGFISASYALLTAKPVPETTKARLENFVERHVDKDAKKYTDENRAYAGLKNHESVNHSVGEYVRGMAHTNGMESFWSVMKRGYDGVFHHMSEPHLYRYVNEFAGRHNIRDMDTVDMMGTMAENIVGSRLTYNALIEPGRLDGDVV